MIIVWYLLTMVTFGPHLPLSGQCLTLKYCKHK